MHLSSGINQLSAGRFTLVLQVKPLDEEYMVIYNELCATENKYITIGFQYGGGKWGWGEE